MSIINLDVSRLNIYDTAKAGLSPALSLFQSDFTFCLAKSHFFIFEIMRFPLSGNHCKFFFNLAGDTSINFIVPGPFATIFYAIFQNFPFNHAISKCGMLFFKISLVADILINRFGCCAVVSRFGEPLIYFTKILKVLRPAKPIMDITANVKN